MHKVSEFYGIYRSAARTNASAVSADSSQAERIQFQMCLLPDVRVSQNSLRQFSSACLDKGVS